MDTSRPALEQASPLTVVRDRLEVVLDPPPAAEPGATWAGPGHLVPTSLGVHEVAPDRVELAWALTGL